MKDTSAMLHSEELSRLWAFRRRASSSASAAMAWSRSNRSAASRSAIAACRASHPNRHVTRGPVWSFHKGHEMLALPHALLSLQGNLLDLQAVAVMHARGTAVAGQ